MGKTTHFLSPVLLSAGFAAVRIIAGILMIYHGWEVLDAGKMKGYGQWLGDLSFPAPAVAAYLGKGSELLGGLLLTLGLFTRFAALILAVTLAVVCFVMGSGRIFTDDQHPFLFVLLCSLFFFTGAGKWSLDHYLFGNKNPFS